MKYLADKLEAMDLYFENKSQSEKWMMIAFFAGIIGFFAYSTFFPYAKRLDEEGMLRTKTISKKINDEHIYLNSISRAGDKDYMVRNYTSQIKSKSKLLDSYKKRIVLIDTNLDKLSDLLFNQKSWSLFLNSITSRASANNVELFTLSSNYVDNNGSFGHVLEIGLSCKGKFKNIINFMNDLEQNTLVTDVYNSRIYSDANRSSIYSDVNISVWGVNH